MKNSLVSILLVFAALLALPLSGTAQETVADYQTLVDGALKVSPNGPKTLSFTLPANFVKGTDKARPILSFKAKATNGAPTVKVELNDGQQYSLKVLGGGTVMTAYEVLKSSSFDTVGNNTIQFRAEGGNVDVADVVLWYQIKLPN